MIRVYLWLKPAGATHRAVVARFAAWFDGAGLFILKEVDELGHRRFFNTEPVQTRMPRGMHARSAYLSFDLDQATLQFVESRTHRGEL